MPLHPQHPSSTITPEVAPTFVTYVVNRIELDFWIHKDFERQLVQLMVKKHSDRRPWRESEHYPIVTITAEGECYRNSGVPEGWGFCLTAEHRVKEIR